MPTDPLSLDELDALASAVIAAEAAYEALDPHASCYFEMQAINAARDAYSVVTPAVVRALLARVRGAEQDTARLDAQERSCAEVKPDGMDGWLVRIPATLGGMRQGHARYGAHRLREALDDAIAAAPSISGSER